MRRIGYIRLSPAGASREAQEAALIRDGAVDVLHVEAADAAGTPARDAAIAALERDDELVVATPSRLAGGRDDTLAALKAIAARGARLRIAAGARSIVLLPDAFLLLELFVEADRETRLEVARLMREHRADKMRSGAGRAGGRRPRLVEGDSSYEAAKAAWADPRNSVNDAARLSGVSVATLYRVFGRRTA